MGLATLVSFALLAAPAAYAAPAISGGATVHYVEQHPPTNIGSGLTITGGTSYDGQFMDFTVDDATADENLTLERVATADPGSGVVSVVGSSVYLGNGTEAQPIGSIDPTYDGAHGRTLRVDFASPFGNPGFEEPGLVSWTALKHRVDLGVTEIAGRVTQDTSTYPSNAPNADNNAPGWSSWTVEATTEGSPTEGTYALRLRSSMQTRQVCDVVHGPAVYSEPFEAAADDRIYFDWRAFAGDDAYHVFGYLLDQDGGQTEVLDTYTTDPDGSTDWATTETVIPATGSYRFVFVAGTYDATCGRAAGAQLLIDNVRVFGNKVDDTVVSALAQKLRYENTSDDPAATRTVTVTAQSNDSGRGSGSVTVDIEPVDDPPVLDAPASTTFTNTAGDDTFSTVTGTLTASDPDSADITYDLVGATGTTWRTLVGTHATLRVHTSGAYIVEPHAAALEAQMRADTEAFTITATADGASDGGSLTVQVAIDPSPPGAPIVDEVEPGDSRATIHWQPGEWIGGSDTTGHAVEYSTDDGESWTTSGEHVGTETTATITGLTPGTPHRFRVAATNASGTSHWSDPSVAVTPQTVQQPVTVVAGDVVYGDTLELAIDGGSGSGNVSYRVTTGPCELEGVTLSSTDVGPCTIEATKDGDTTYYAAADDVELDVTPRELTVTGARVVTKTYDGTTTARITGATLTGVVGDDDVALTGHTSGTFGQADVGRHIPVSTSMALTGGTADRYVLVQPLLTGSIREVPPPPAPAPDPRPDPTVRPGAGNGIVHVDGDPADGTLDSTPDTVTVRADGFELRATPTQADGQPSGTVVDQLLRVPTDGGVQVGASGFRAGSTVAVWLFSEPRFLGELSVLDDGTLEEATLLIPDHVLACSHTLQVVGTTATGEQVTVSLGVWVTSAALPFGDVDADGEHGPAIGCLASRGIVHGREGGPYAPAASTSRGQLAAMLARALGLAGSGSGGYADTAGSTHRDAIAAVSEAGVVSGFTDGTFRPGRSVTRGQVATMLARAAGLSPIDPERFIDTVGTTHAGEIEAAAEAGLVTGYPDGTFRADEAVTRAQIASMLVRLVDVLETR